MKRFTNQVLFVALLAPVMLHGFVYSPNTFYATEPFSEPRYTRNGLTSLTVELSGGYANDGYNGTKDKVNVLEIYGDYDIAQLGIGSIGDPLSSDYNASLAALYASGFDESGTGKFSYSGKFDAFQGNIYLAQNISNGFFLDMIIDCCQSLFSPNISTVSASSGLKLNFTLQ